MKTSEQINDLIPALTSFQAEVEAASKDRKNPHFKSNYADLTSIWNAIRPALAKNQLAVVQAPSFEGDRVVITTRLFHKSGQWIESSMSAKPQQDTPQAIGSTITYLKRYVIAAMLGVVADDDDDGNAASGNGNQTSFPVAKYSGSGPDKMRLLDAMKANGVSEDLMGAIAADALRDKPVLSNLDSYIKNHRVFQ